MKKHLFIIFFFTSLLGQAQSLKEIEQFETSYQNCLDNGGFMKGCSIKFYSQTDSLLNVVYNNLKMKINSTAKSNLKKEQLEWLKKRDAYFIKARKETISEVGNFEDSQDFQMILIDKKSSFVMIRVKELLKRI